MSDMAGYYRKLAEFEAKKEYLAHRRRIMPKDYKFEHQNAKGLK